jgi:hypothetical protein
MEADLSAGASMGKQLGETLVIQHERQVDAR